ncbi:MAG TPA: LLM class flavin-dependent oxidoreductase [Solirubrobacteraceae bacterium]|jgi:alkanesulfonate monooxygenase SsuD/methylene tetrahydromethanopterin reductase-like flavin-dependent oxidoreductase (luciferase family)
MRRGLTVAPFETLASPRELAELAASAEAAGWDGFFVWDHLLYTGVTDIADPWTCLAAIAMRTSRIAIGPMITPLPRRRPHVLARQAVSLDHLCEGRLILGLGLGDDGGDGELSCFGEEVDPRRRGAMLTEGLEVLTGLLSGEAVDHLGEHYRASGARFRPTARRPGGIPIWLAARWPNRVPMRRAAGYDGLFTIRFDAPADLVTVRQWVGDARQSDRPFEFIVDAPPGTDPDPWAEAGADWLLTELRPGLLDLAGAQELIATGPDGGSA